MHPRNDSSYTAFAGSRRIARGTLHEVAARAKQALDAAEPAPLLVFRDDDASVVELDLRGTVSDVLRRLPISATTAAPASESTEPALAPPPPRGPGRPKLGVVAREVTLLPRHWDWLGSQPGGASVALRKLVEEARRRNEAGDRTRHLQERAYRFMVTMAGHAAGFEEASRALFAGDGARFAGIVAPWPADVRDHLSELAAPVFSPDTQEAGA